MSLAQASRVHETSLHCRLRRADHCTPRPRRSARLPWHRHRPFNGRGIRIHSYAFQSPDSFRTTPPLRLDPPLLPNPAPFHPPAESPAPMASLEGTRPPYPLRGEIAPSANPLALLLAQATGGRRSWPAAVPGRPASASCTVVVWSRNRPAGPTWRRKSAPGRCQSFVRSPAWHWFCGFRAASAVIR